MYHDPCNPLPSSGIPSGLPSKHWHIARVGEGRNHVGPPQSHVVVGAAPSYLGCDHKQGNHARVKSAQAAPPLELPAARVPHTSAIVVATLPIIPPSFVSFAALPEPELQLPMPEPSSALMFLFAILVTVGARRLSPRRWTLPPLFALNLAPLTASPHRHRSKSIACYHAFQHAAS